ncbi:MAG TPA: hypothetical protein VKC56_07115 [Gallionellaceae bacterium]|nr:hypothetical protein [Gallionellaceae bacterium]
MSGINLFEQQALALRAAAPAVPSRRPSLVPARETPLAAAMRFIEGANVSQCGKVAAQLSVRLFALEKMHAGMKAANLNEAAQFMADAVLNIAAVAGMNGARDVEDEAPCTCGRCDDCVAARSDEHHDRKRDATSA